MGQLFPGLASVPALHPQDIIPAYRTVPLLALRKYSADPLNTAGSRVTGGRYNPPEEFTDAFEMLYLAENSAVAHAEARVISFVPSTDGRTLIQPGPDQRPRVDVCVHLKLRNILDLTDATVLQTLELIPADLMQEWLPMNQRGQLARSQQLASAARRVGRFQALLYPSARSPGGRNYAVYPDLVSPADRAVHDPDGELDVFRRGRGEPQDG